MSDPVSWLMIGGTLLQAGGQVSSANSAAAEAETEAKVAGQQASAAEDAKRRENRDFMGRQSAAIAESDIGFGGSTRLLQEQSAAEAELDALNIRYEGTLRRSFATQRAQAVRREGYLSAAGTLLMGGAGAYGAYQSGRGGLGGAGAALKIPSGSPSAYGRGSRA